MFKIRCLKKAGIRWGLMAGLILLPLLSLVLTGTGIAATILLEPENSYFFAATSSNSAGLESVYFNVVDNAEPNPRTVTIDTSSDIVSFNDVITVNVYPPETVAISKVQLFVNEVQIAETATAPFAFFWDTSLLSRGEYDISVKAIDFQTIDHKPFLIFH